MKKLIITTNKSISSKFVFHTICDIAESLYEKHKDDYHVIFICKYSAVKRIYSLLRKEKRSVFFDEIVLESDYYKNNNYAKDKVWRDIYNDIDISTIPEVEKIIEIGSALSAASFLRDGEIGENKLFNNRAHFNYLSIKAMKNTLMLTYKIAKERNILLEHHIIDPQEFNYRDIDTDIKYTRHFPYTSNSFNFTRDDSFLEKYKKNRIHQDKDIDFTFGYTILTEDRKNNIHEEIQKQLESKTIQLFLRDKYNDIDTFVKKDVYLDYIARSRFTLIIPAYNDKTFSAFRYIESIYNDCIPIILDTNNISEAKESLYIPDYLLTSIEDICTKIDQLDFDEVLRDLKDNM